MVAASAFSPVLILILMGLHGGCLGQSEEPRLIDLTWTIEEGMIVYPVQADYRFTIVYRGEQPDGYYLESNNIFMAEHTGTHLDAPAHFVQGAWRLDEIPLGQLTGPGVVVDVREKIGNNSDYAVTQQDLQDWEREYGRIPDDSILMLRTGWGEWYWEQGPEAYLGTETKDVNLVHFPGLHPEGAQWLVDNRKVKMVGVDVMGADTGQASVKTLAVHQILLPNNVLILENVAHLDKMPPTGSTVYAMPIKIGQGSGAPARVFAIVDSRTSKAGPTTPNLAAMSSAVFLFIMAFT
ncbi:Hypp1946 [Branchiostoma lanceolatum]|uniref:Hypp1946 protein n=1 Tax=Branchiostoma lanceolatum TaxID=7740 RepID=A0A8J9ZPG0_BRALA|nr:Hypp1946 [Branchiostoma lanceolatum]